ncbi:hypothetical protein Tco_1178931 [Tanacetum coccineum]
MLAQQVDMGEGSGQPTDPQHTSTSVQPSNKEPITVPSSSQPKKTHRPRKSKRATEISQSSGPIPLVADETVTKEMEDRMEKAATTTSSLEAEQDSGSINRTQSMATLNEPSPQGTGSGSGPRCQDTILGDAEAQTRFETTSKQSNDLPLLRVNTLGSGEDRMKLKELMDLCTKLSDRVLDLETTKTAQAKEIANLKKRVKNLERKRKSRPPGMNLFKIGTSRRRSLGEEDASKQGSNLKQRKQSSIFEDRDFDEEFGVNMDEAIEQVYDANKDTVEGGEVQVPTTDMEVNTASASVTTAGVSVSTAKPITTISVNITTAEPSTPPTTTTIVIEDEDLTISQTLMKMRSEKSKVRGVVMKEPSETATRPTVPPQQHDPKDKGKDSEVVKGSKDRAEGSETRAEGSSKRAGEDIQQESTKKQKMDDDKEKEELKQCFEIVPEDGDDVTIDVTPLSVKIPIVNYKIYQEGKKSFFQIIRADGKTQMYLTFSKMLKNFDREDLEVLWRIVKAI